MHISCDNVLLFDLDGTLVDSNLANFLSYKKAIIKILDINIEKVYDKNTRFEQKSINEIIPTISDENLFQIVKEKQKVYKNFLSQTFLNQKIYKILEKYSSTNKCILVTKSKKQRALSLIKFHSLDNFFFQMFFCSRVLNKYKFVITKTNISSNLIIAFEDKQEEIKQAINAGICEKNIIKVNK